MPALGYVKVDVLNAKAVQAFLARVGKLSEEAPTMTGYEVQSELRQAFEELAESIR